MKGLTLAVTSTVMFGATIMCSMAFAANDPVVATTLREDGTTNTWTQAELQAALGLINRMYKREIGTDAGRRRWHGDRIGQYILPTGETNATGRAVFVRVDLYADGFVMTNRAVRARQSIIADPEAAAKAAAEARGACRVGIRQPPARPRRPPRAPEDGRHHADRHGRGRPLIPSSRQDLHTDLLFPLKGITK